VQETSETTGIKRRYLKVKIKNTGNAIANSCSAKLTFIETDSTIIGNPCLRIEFLFGITKNNIER
jgi:hypothetical protein